MGCLTMAEEKRLIDANVVRERLKSDIVLGETEKAFMRNFIDNAPTVDAVEVVHGEWISWEKAENFIPSPDRHECSVCHDAAQVLVNGLELLSPYCPNCSAKMDGGKDNETE